MKRDWKVNRFNRFIEKVFYKTVECIIICTERIKIQVGIIFKKFGI